MFFSSLSFFSVKALLRLCFSYNSNYIISSLPRYARWQAVWSSSLFHSLLSAYPVESLFYSFAAAYSSQPIHPTNAVCTLSHALLYPLCIVQKSSTKIVFPVLRWHCCKVPAYWCLSCLCILSICFYKRVVRKVILRMLWTVLQIPSR